MCAACSECSLNVVGQVFVGTCSVGLFSDLYDYQGTNVAGYIVVINPVFQLILAGNQPA